jgi:hypothetical protein
MGGRSLADPIAATFPNYPFDSSSSLGWATVKDNLILVTVDKESDAGTMINFAIFNDITLYMFSMPYQIYDPLKRVYVVQEPEDIGALKLMVQSFAERL